ncbi:MAG: hypothetical protein AAGJ93_05915 [Bacteroidota bacterium]
MRPLLILILFASLLYSCSSTQPSVGEAGKYFPYPEYLEDGLVNKYYFHYQSEDGYEKTTDIRYYQYKQLDEKRLSLSIYDPGFEMTSRLILRMQDEQLLVEDEMRHYRGENLDVQLEQNVYLSWTQDSSQYAATVHYPYGITEQTHWVQTGSRDSLVMERPAKVITRQRQRSYEYPDQDDRSMQTFMTNIYVQGFGLFAGHYIFEEGTATLELIKQMPLSEFEKLSNDVPKRVAYIDPNNTLDAFSDFATCTNKGQIYDYYNGTPDAGYRGGKRGLWEIFNQQVDPVLLGQESGYLTFRFVINCTGEAGWFVTEEVDLDFNIKTFPEATVSHLFAIIREINDWEAAVIREEAVDAYAYLTLKMKDGKIIEILP